MFHFYPLPTGDEKQVREAARAFTDEKLRPFAIEDDEKARFRRDSFDEAARRGLTAIALPKEYGGRGLSSRCYYGSMEEMARGSMAMAVTVGVTNLIQGAISVFGTDGQKKKYLTRLTSGEWLAAFSLSEPGSGSDAASLKCSARRAKGGYVLNGTKCWCSTAGVADLYLVMARTGDEGAKGISSFLVPKDTPGFRVGKQEKKLGMRASPLAELIFEDCFVAEEQRLADEGQGFTVALSQLDAGRISIGVAGTGLAMEGLERAWRFLHAERAQGSEVGEAVRQNLAALYAPICAVRGLVNEAADARDRKERFSLLASSVKLLGSDLAVQVASEAIGAMGPRGATRELEVERLLRDAKALQIVEGTNQIQKIVLARELDRFV